MACSPFFLSPIVRCWSHNLSKLKMSFFTSYSEFCFPDCFFNLPCTFPCQHVIYFSKPQVQGLLEIWHWESTRPTNEPSFLPQGRCSGSRQPGPTSRLGCSQNPGGDRKGQPLRPSEDHPTSLNPTVPSAKHSSNRSTADAVRQRPASRPAPGAALGYCISSPTVAPETQVPLVILFLPILPTAAKAQRR